jgi:outer membrane protein OmpU
MTNLKKLGLTALASTLVAVSAQAGDLSITGSAKMAYAANTGNGDANTAGSRFSMSKGMTAKGSGELDNGFGITVSHAFSPDQNAAGTADKSSYLTLDMGDMGTLSYVQADATLGAKAIDDVMPTADEEPSNGLTGLKGGVSMPGTGFNYEIALMGATIDIGYSDTSEANATDDGGNSAGAAADASSSISVQMSPMEGLSVFGGTGSHGQADGKDLDHDIYGLTYAFGPVTVGYQHNEMDDSDSAGSDYETDMLAISFAVNDSLSISYGDQETETSASGVDQEVSGISIGYSVGGMTFKAHANEADNAGHVSGTTSEHTEIAVTFAF